MIKYKRIVTSQQIQTYQQRIESINFTAVITRSNVTQIVFKLSKFLINSSTFYMNSVNRILKYLNHTQKLKIRFSADSSFDNHSKNNKIFLISSDAFFTNDSTIRHSSQDYAFKIFNDLIDRKAFKQRTVITSFTETKLLVISIVEKKLIWWERLFEAIHFRINQRTIIQCNNQQTIRALVNNKLIIKLRHIDIHKHWLRQEIALSKIDIEWVSTSKILADELTKKLSPQKQKKFLRLLDLKASMISIITREIIHENENKNIQIDKVDLDHLHQESVSN
jgi:hypothetical protein